MRKLLFWGGVALPLVLVSPSPAQAQPQPQDLPEIRYCADPDWAPYEVITDQGVHEGIAADLLALVAERAGVRLTLVPSATWAESVAMTREGRCQMLSFLNQTPAREEWLAFTEPMFIDPNVIVTREDRPYVSDLADESGKVMVLPEGTSIEERVRRDYPGILIRTTASEAEAFAMVSRGEADMTLRSLSVSVYIIKKMGWFNLKVAGQVPGYENRLRIAVRRDEAGLVDLLNPGVLSITAQERREIANRHVSITVTSPLDRRVILWVLGLFTVALGTSLLWGLWLHRVNQRLRESETRHRLLADNATDVIWTMNMDGRFTYVSPSVEKLRGYTVAEVMQQDMSQALTPDSLKLAQEGLASVLDAVAAGQRMPAFRGELEQPCKDGSTVWTEVTTTGIYDQTGAFVGILGVTRDISDRVALVRELERSNADLEQFAYVVSHDLRQPLRMVTSFTQLLGRTLNELRIENEKTREFMGFIFDGARRMDQMLVSLLDYSRVGRDGEPMVEESSRSLLDEALRYLAPQIEDTGATVQITGDWPVVQASGTELVRLFQNLVSNALKYQNKGRTPIINLAVDRKGEEWLFSVRDNGIGIAAGQQDRLFKVFQRLHTHTAYEGTGIGLAICRKIVERHGGTLWVESQGEGHGSTFFFTLPVG